ncbi:MAG: helix-turn-helix transcriptional regulator [Chloroflexi bacterium]|nr:helix-turn-helix transcriptional regulator [Chloroflexota bacterium]
MTRRTGSPRVRLKPEPLWERINRLNISQNELAELADISSGYLSQLISGRKSPSPDVRRRLQAALDIGGFDELFVQEYEDE